MIRVVVFMFVAGPLMAADLTINSGNPNVVTGTTVMNCLGLTVNYSDTEQCCVGNSCSDLDTVELLNPNQSCPAVVMDGYRYTVSGDIRIIHSVRLIDVAGGSMTSCRQPDGSFPTTAGFEQLNLNFNNVFAGIESVSIDVDRWELIITSVDGNLTCNGGESVDVIFENGFEQ
jgi:hypothetical protein